MAIISVVLGIVSIVLGLNGILGILFSGVIYGTTLTLWGAPLTGIIGLVLAILSKRGGNSAGNNKFSKIGLLCSIGGVILCVIMFIVVFSVFSTWEIS